MCQRPSNREIVNELKIMEQRICIIQEEMSITINKDIETVFSFISDLRNDKFWRKEINSTTTDGDPKLNIVAIEDSRLSKKMLNYIAKLECVEYAPNKSITYQTLPNHYFLKSSRKV